MYGPQTIPHTHWIFFFCFSWVFTKWSFQSIVLPKYLFNPIMVGISFRFHNNNNYYYYHYYYYYKSSIKTLSDNFSLESEWQQVSSDLQESSKYPNRFNSAVVWMVSILLLIFCSSILFSRSLETLPSVPTTTGITTIIVHYALGHCFIAQQLSSLLESFIQSISQFWEYFLSINAS